MNLVVLLGRLTRDPELRYTEDGKAVTTFGVATNRGEEMYFAECTVFGEKAEWVVDTLEKGSGIFVKGRLVTRKTEKNKPTTRVIVENIRRIEFTASLQDEAVDELLEEAIESTEQEEVDVI